MSQKIKSFIEDLKREFKRINWPSREEALRLSGVVIVISLIVAAFLGALDYIFSTILKHIIKPF